MSAEPPTPVSPPPYSETVPFFSVINDQLAIVITQNTDTNGLTGIDILRGASDPEATYDSSARANSPRCFPGQHEQYIQGIMGFAAPPPGYYTLPIYWMKGRAGLGKSAIAQTCTERFQKMGKLGAAFFFSVHGQRKPEKLFPSLAYQLSALHPTYHALVEDRINRDKTLVSKSMRFQFQHLIADPLRELEESGKGIRDKVHVFIDGLDECEGTDAQCEIIRTIAAAASDGVLPLRWLFFSRPKPHIETVFSEPSISPCCYRMTLQLPTNPSGDMEVFLKDSFDNILLRTHASQDPWPSNEDVQTVIRGAGGSSIYATTVVRFVGHPDMLSPQYALRAVIDTIIKRRSRFDPNADTPFAGLDALYMLILQHVPPSVMQSVHSLLSLLCQFRNPSAIFTANVLGMSKREFEIICGHLSAVICFSNPGKELELNSGIDTTLGYTNANPGIVGSLLRQISEDLGGQIYCYDASFHNFILDPARSGVHCVAASEVLSKRFIEIHLDYDRSFCWSRAELILAPGIPDSAASLSYPYTHELANSLLKALIYARAGEGNPDRFPTPQQTGAWNINRDFRKHLYICTSLPSVDFMHNRSLWGWEYQRNFFQDVVIEHISSGFSITEFKLMIQWQEQARIIRRYHPNITHWMGSFFRDESEAVESAYYRVGYGWQTIIWYWEINHNLRSYRSFHAIDWEIGRRRFRELFHKSNAR